MSLYLDTSVIVPLLVRESTSATVDRWLGRAGDAVTTSRWAVVELASAIGLKVRSGRLDRLEPGGDAGLAQPTVEGHHGGRRHGEGDREMQRVAGLEAIEPA